MTAAQATIRRLYEQVRVLETEAARPQKRRTRVPYVCVLVAAVGIGAVTAGVSNTHVAAAIHPHAVHVAAPVVHLIDPPSERARALPAAPSRRRFAQNRLVRHAAAPARHHFVLTQHEVPAAAPAPAHIVLTQHKVAAAPAPAPAAPVAPAPVAPAPVAVPARATAPVHHTAPPAKPAPATPKPAPAPKPRAAKSAPDPVGIDSAVVSTADEPLPGDAGATTSTTPTPTTPTTPIP